MTMVIDASVACKWFFNEPLAAEARDGTRTRAPGLRLPVPRAGGREQSPVVTADRAFADRVAGSRWRHLVENLGTQSGSRTQPTTGLAGSIGSWLVRIEAELRELRCLILEEASCETPAAEPGEGSSVE